MWLLHTATGGAAELAPYMLLDADDVQNAHTGHFGRRMRTTGGRVLPQCPARAMRVVVVGVLAQDQPQVPFAGDQNPVQARAAGAADPAFRDCVRAAPGQAS